VIFTFYSYKGGVGRSMALANVGELLCRKGLRVLMVDFDLEAPGLEKFFPVDHGKVRRQLGLLDLLASYKQAMARDPLSGVEGSAETPAFKRLRESFTVPIYPDLPNRGRLDLLPAGRRDDPDDEQLARYAHNLRVFDWQEFYFKWGGELFFEWLRREIGRLWDVALVDSRTGVTEMGGICAYQLADALVMLCASSLQNVEGVQSVVRNFGSPRVERLRRGRPPQHLIVPARVEQSDPTLLRSFRERFEKAFDLYTPETLAAAGKSFWDLGIPYEPRYAFEERVARLGDEEQRPDDAFRRLVEAMALLAPPDSKLGRLRADSAVTRGHGTLEAFYAAPQYDTTRKTAPYDVFLSHASSDKAVVEGLARRLTEVGLRPFLDKWHLVPGLPWQEALEEALHSSRTCAVFIGRDLGPWLNEETRSVIDERVRDPDFRIIPVLLPGGRVSNSQLPGFLRRLTWVDFRPGLEDDEAFERLVAGIRGIAPRLQAPETVNADVPPYRGLAPFREEDAQFFFGREGLIGSLLERLEKRRYLFLAGPSGCGKSSLVLAGLIPALRRGALPSSEGWRFLILRPGTRPLRRLAEEIVKILGSSIALADLEEALRRAPDRVTALVEQEMKEAGDVVLIIDQLEELWTQCRDPEERDLFSSRLLAGLLSSRLILTLRADFIAFALGQPDLSRLFQNHQFLVPPLGRADLKRAIEEPARRAGLAFEPGLVDAIISDLDAQPGALPLLQTLLFELWEARQSGFLTHESYQRLGGVRDVLSRQAEAVYQGLSEDGGRLARRVLLHLVHVDEAVTTRRRARLDEIAFSPKERDEAILVIDQLATARIVTVDRGDGGVTVELTHETLIHHWARLRRWIEDVLESLRFEQRLLTAAHEWERHGGGSQRVLEGEPLSEAEAWAKRHADRIGALVRKFLEASRIESLRRRRRRKWRDSLLAAVTAAVTGAICTIILMLFAPQDIAKNRLARLNQSFLDMSKGERGHVVVTSPDKRVRALAFDDWLWLGAADGSADPAPTVLKSPAEIRAFTFSPHGDALAVAAADGSASLFDPQTADLVQRFEGHEGAINALAFRPSDQALATASEDGTLRLWDLDSGMEIFRVQSPDGRPLLTVAFSDDGERIRTTAEGGDVLVWDAFSGDRVE